MSNACLELAEYQAQHASHTVALEQLRAWRQAELRLHGARRARSQGSWLTQRGGKWQTSRQAASRTERASTRTSRGCIGLGQGRKALGVARGSAPHEADPTIPS